MVLWLPTTWFEDLGRARRTSTYATENLDNGRGVPRYVASCYISVDGYGRWMYLGIDEANSLGPERAVDILRQKIRETYPWAAETERSCR